MPVRYETELYSPLKRYFIDQGYDVKAEVCGCDLVASHRQTKESLILEMKKTFTLSLLLQGLERQKKGVTVWLAVERRVKKGMQKQRFSEITALCQRLKLGFMTVTFFKVKEPLVEIWCSPQILAAKLPPRLQKEFKARSADYNIGGSSQKKLLTAYRERALICGLALFYYEVGSAEQVTQWTHCANARNILRQNYYGWFKPVPKRLYTLTQKGESALSQFREFILDVKPRFPWAKNLTF